MKEILKFPTKSLKESSERIDVNAFQVDGLGTKIFSDLKNLIHEMDHLVYRLGALGLAAPQVGVNQRVVIIKTQSPAQSHFIKPVSLNHPPHNLNYTAMVNPEIIHRSKTTRRMNEGCLSFPNAYAWITRPESIRVRWFDIYSMEYREDTFNDLEASIVQHECLPRRSRLVTDSGMKLIGDIKIGDMVEGFDESELKFTMTKVLGVSSKPNCGKRWVKLSYTMSKHGPHSNLICTEDHPCSYVDSIFDNVVKYTEATNMVGRYILRKISNRERNKEIGLYNSHQFSAMVGSLLGDGLITSKGEFVTVHSHKKEGYARHRRDLFNGSFKSGTSGFSTNKTIRVYCSGTAQTDYLRGLFYSQRKKVSPEACTLIDEIALAYWYMDDGNISKRVGKDGRVSYYGCRLHTEGFCDDSVQNLVNHLKNRFNIDCHIWYRKVRGTKKPVIAISTIESQKFYSLVAKYVDKSMDYKLPERFRGEQIELCGKNLDYSIKRICGIQHKKVESKLYNLKTTTGNFVVNDTLVHNCDHLDGVLLVDKIGPLKSKFTQEYFKKNR